MSAILSQLQPLAGAEAAHRILAGMARFARAAMQELFATPDTPATLLPAKPYRPERHYMRGPGPKWRAKHGQYGQWPPRD